MVEIAQKLTFKRGDRPKYDVSYRCPWCNRIDSDKDRAKIHSLSCSLKKGSL